jgi:hypothetical protein
MKVEPRPKVMLGIHMVQCEADRVIGALLMPTENRLLLERLSSNWAVEDPSGVGYMLESCGLWSNRGVRFCWGWFLVQM